MCAYMASVGVVLTLPQILQVKEKIAAEKGWEAPTQKLIYSGEHLCF